MNSSGRTIEFFKVDSHMMVTEIRPVKCSYIDKKSQTELKTTKWMELQHWRELEKMVEEILKEYKENDLLYGIKKVQHNIYYEKIGEKIKLGYIYQPYKSCGCHIVSPREDYSESDSENEDSNTLKDKGGRFNKFRFCDDSLVVSVCPIIVAKKSSTKYQLSDYSNSPQRMNIKLKKALKLHDAKEHCSLVSEYFISQGSSSNAATKSHRGSNKPLSFKMIQNPKNSSSPESVLAAHAKGNELFVPKPKSLFDTDYSSANSSNYQKSSISSDSNFFNWNCFKQEKTGDELSGQDKVEAQKENCSVHINTRHSLRKRQRVSYEESDNAPPVEYDDHTDFVSKEKLNNYGKIRKKVKNEHDMENSYEESSYSSSTVKNVNEKNTSSFKSKEVLKKIKVKNEQEGQTSSTMLVGKLYSDELNNTQSNEKRPRDYDNNVSFFSTDYQTENSGDHEMTQVAETKLLDLNISKGALKKTIPTTDSQRSKLCRARMISIFGSDSPNYLFEDCDNDLFAAGSLDNKFEGFEVHKNKMSLQISHEDDFMLNDRALHNEDIEFDNVKQSKKLKYDSQGKYDYSSTSYIKVAKKAGNDKKLKDRFGVKIQSRGKSNTKSSNGNLDHCSQSYGKAKFKNIKKKIETLDLDTSISNLSNKSKKKYKANSSDACSLNIWNKTKLTRNKKSEGKNLAVDHIKVSLGNDLDDFQVNDNISLKTKKTFSKNIKAPLITTRKRGRPKKVISEFAVKNSGRSSIDLFEDDDALLPCNGSSSSNAASTDNGCSKYSSIIRTSVRRDDHINYEISNKSNASAIIPTSSSDEESDEDMNYVKNRSYLSKSLLSHCVEKGVANNNCCLWQDDSYELPNLELTQVECTKVSCNEEIIPKSSINFEDLDQVQIEVSNTMKTTESEEFLPKVTSYLTNLSLDDLLAKYEDNLDYLWSIAHQEIYTERNMKFQTPNLKRPDASCYLCLYDTQIYSKLGDIIVKEFGKFTASRGHGDGSSYAYFVVIPELLKKLLSDWTVSNLSQEKYLTDQECEDLFFEIALNAPDPPDSFTFKF